MKKLLFIHVVIAITLIISSCSSSSNKEEGSSEDTGENEKTPLQEEASTDIGEAFQPPHFQLEAFDVSTINEGELLIQIDYLFDQELFDFLKDQQLEYYYLIKYPHQLKEDLNLEASAPISGNIFDEPDSQMNGTIQINEIIPNDYPIEEIIEDPTGFQLIILNKDKDPVHIIDDIYHYLGYDPDLSQTINK